MGFIADMCAGSMTRISKFIHAVTGPKAFGGARQREVEWRGREAVRVRVAGLRCRCWLSQYIYAADTNGFAALDRSCPCSHFLSSTSSRPPFVAARSFGS